MTNKLYADGKDPRCTYTDGGNLVTRTRARGIVTTFAYDELTGCLVTIQVNSTDNGRAGVPPPAADGGGTPSSLPEDAVSLWRVTYNGENRQIRSENTADESDNHPISSQCRQNNHTLCNSPVALFPWLPPLDPAPVVGPSSPSGGAVAFDLAPGESCGPIVCPTNFTYGGDLALFGVSPASTGVWFGVSGAFAAVSPDGRFDLWTCGDFAVILARRMQSGSTRS